MVAALILILVVCVFLAFFVGKNITNMCTFWLFKTYTDLSVTVIVFIAFAAGIVFSLLCYLAAKLVKASRKNEIDDASKNAKQEQKKQDRFDLKMEKLKMKIGRGKKSESQEKSDDDSKADEKAENNDNQKSDVDSSSKTSDKQND